MTVFGKIDLTQLKHVVMSKKGKEGKEVKGLFIPIEVNDLFEGKEGNVYLDLVAFEVKNSKYEDTHIVKQSFSKDKRESMSEEEKNAMPILGNLKVGGSSSATKPQNATPGVVLNADDDDDLPF